MRKLLLFLLVMALLELLVACGQPPVPQPANSSVPSPHIEVDVWAGLSTPPTLRPNPKYEEARICLALNAYHEARGESHEGQVAVGQVALRRAGLDYRHVCAEIYKPGQFSWTADRPRGTALPTDERWPWALAAADVSLQWAARGVGVDFSRGATYYHATHVNPYWTRGLELVAQIDNHRFYR